MAQVINTNYLSLVTQNNLNKSQGALGSAIERLSSGMRINSAKDDAAGQAIANRFTSNVNGLTQASRNANDGISIAQTTEGALNEINNNLQRIRELTVQAKNGTNSDSDIKSIQDEVGERLAEINRISEQTQFNGVKVLSGEKSEMTIQVGTNDKEVIKFNLDKIDNEVLGVKDFQVASKAQTADTTEVDAEVVLGVKGSGKLTFAGGDLKPGAKVYALLDEKGDKVEGQYVVKGKNAADKDVSYVATAGAATEDAPGTPDNKSVEMSLGAEFKALTADQAKEHNDKALKTLDTAISKVDATRSNLGAIQNRFESTINNLNNTVNNLSAARSRILDADYATEVSNMSRGQILQQAGTSVLAQANQVPQSVLSLLR